MTTNNTYDVEKQILFRDGVVQLTGLLDSDDLSELNNAIDDNINRPSPFGTQMQKDASGGKFFMDFNNWNRLDSIGSFCRKDKIIKAIKKLTGSKTGRLFHDHVLVKEGASIATPWHQDRPYYIFKGDLNLSIWMPSSGVSRNSSLIYWRGSHLLNKIYMPKGFADGKNLGVDSRFQELRPELIPKADIIDFDMKAGDALVFFNNTIHGSKPHTDSSTRKALSLRILLDGAAMTEKYVNATPPFDRLGVKVVEDGAVPDRFPILWD